ncbi:MAG: Hsp70 family protein [Myxococcota bacterium]
MASPPRYIVGIDLGTTHTVVAYADAHTAGGGGAIPVIEPFDVDQLVAPGEVAPRPLLPSVRYHAAEGELPPDADALPWPRNDEEDRPVVGELALTLGAKVPGRLVTSAKSWLSHAAVDRTAPILPWGAPPEVSKVSPVEASASYLRHVRRAWDHRFADHPLVHQEVVLTVPASFDEAARALTLKAAKQAGLPKVRLVEEPQAAFYAWLDRHRDDAEDALADVRLAAVVDVGGGTTDLTLIKVELRGEQDEEDGRRVRLTRIAVGDHLMLGGDNMDLALAKRAEERLSTGKPLGSARFHQLVQQCRVAKERLLADDAPEAARVTVLGSGSKLVGGAVSTEIGRDEVREMVLDGFFPPVGPEVRPDKRRGGIVEFGLPYAADPGVTRHLAEFIGRHQGLARDALGDAAAGQGLAVPDAVLFNGGVFRSTALADRVSDVLGKWRDAPAKGLGNDMPDQAVARGAVAYGLARRGLGLRIGGGSPRSYFVVVEGPEGERAKQGVCVLPKGAEEGEEVELRGRTFSLRLGRPVRFHLMTSTSDVQYVAAGDVVSLEDGERYHALPPIAAVLEDEGGREGELPVRLASGLTEVGTLEMSCVAAEDPGRRWKLEFQLRGSGPGEATSAQRVGQLHPRFAEATERLREAYGKSKKDVQRPVKRTRHDLEKILGPRETWETPLLRELFGALFAGVKRRRRSADHERIWFNLVGFTLRPGFGYPLDEWRVRQLAGILGDGVQFVPEAQNWSEWWTMWRRVAGGLAPEVQRKLLDEVEFYLRPPAAKPPPRPPGPKKHGYDDMVRLAGSLEHLPADRKAQVGGWMVERLVKHDENPHTWWAVGRLGARVPFYGSAHNVVGRAVAAEWLRRCLDADWRAATQAPFAAALLARASGDRERDLDPDLRSRVADRLVEAAAPESWVRMVREVAHLEGEDERRIFGEALPPGLRLLD